MMHDGVPKGLVSNGRVEVEGRGLSVLHRDDGAGPAPVEELWGCDLSVGHR